MAIDSGGPVSENGRPSAVGKSLFGEGSGVAERREIRYNGRETGQASLREESIYGSL
jgi:hypothetical protein